MLEKLKEYLEAFEQDRQVVEQSNDDDLITEMVLRYEAEVRATLEEKRKEKLAEIDGDIKTVKKLIEIETAKAEQAAKEAESSFLDGVEVATDYATSADTAENVSI